MRFDEKVVFITGAGHGIGRATALRLASEGAAVVATDVRADTAEETAAAIRGGGTGRTMAAEVDVRNRAQIVAALDAALREFGSVTHLVNNAGLVTMFGLAD